jgi:hypothetical protein
MEHKLHLVLVLEPYLEPMLGIDQVHKYFQVLELVFYLVRMSFLALVLEPFLVPRLGRILVHKFDLVLELESFLEHR